MPPTTHPKLLISVTTPDEALAANRAGADIIDIKDPTAGPLGMAPLQTIHQIAATLSPSDQTSLAQKGKQSPHVLPCLDPVNPEYPVNPVKNLLFSEFSCKADQTLPPSSLSLALGELAQEPSLQHLPKNITFAKTALAQAPANWPHLFAKTFAQRPDITPVLALYAPMHAREAQALGQAHADPISTITLAHQVGAKGILLDTYTKDGRSLLDTLYWPFIDAIIAHTHALGLWIALAGSLRLHHIPTLLNLQPDILGFRGAACTNHNRTASIDPQKIQALKSALPTS